MPKFSNTSKNRLKTCDERLQKLFNEVIKYYDCTIVCGHRTEEEQNKAYNEQNSQLKYPESKHNEYPSKAVDVAPYVSGIGIPWNDVGAFYIFAGRVLTIAVQMGINIRYGGDWDSDSLTKDQKFHDLPHFELID